MNIEFDFGAILVDWRLLAKGITWTIGLTAIATLIGMVVGVACAWARSAGPTWLRWVVGAYVELIRNTPFIVQLFFIFFGLPAAGVKLSPEVASIIAMVANLGAYSTEIIRAGVQAIPRGQIEASAALAMTRFETFRHVVLVPALGKVWPALSSQIIIVMLGSAVCSQIATEELSFAANFIQSRNFRAFETYIITTLIYLCMALLVRQLLAWIGRRYIARSR